MIYITCYFLIIGTDIKFNHTNSAIHSSGHSHSLFTSASDYATCAMKTGTSYFGNLFPTCQHVLGHACHIWYSLWLKSLTPNHSTRAGPVRIHCVMTGVFGRKWKGCAKHWGFFKWTWKIFANFDHWLKRITFWCVISLTWCRIMAVHKCCIFRLKRKNLLSPAVRCWCWGVFSWWLASRDLRYSALQLLGESGACAVTQMFLWVHQKKYLLCC